MYNGILYDKLKPYAEDEKYEDNYWLYTDIIVKFVKYFISFVIVVSLNVAIILTTRNSKKNVMIDTNENQRRKSVTKYSQELTKTLLIFVVFFLISRLVCITVDYLWYFSEYEQYRKWLFLDPIQNFLLMLNSSINFAIYLLIDTRFRRQFLLMLRCQDWFHGFHSTTYQTSNA